MGKLRLRITGDLGFEVWQDIPGYEGYYQISTYGNVRSVERKIWGGKAYYTAPSKTKKLCPHSWGYYQVKLSKENVDKMYMVHRLVALTFLASPSTNANDLQIDHIDGDTKNNSVSNLRWCTNKENCNYELHRKNVSAAMKKFALKRKNRLS